VHPNGFLEDVVALLHREPFKAGHKLVNEFINLVAVADASDVDLNVIFSDQALWVKIEIFNVQSALAFTSPSARPVFRDRLVVKISLGETLASLHGLLKVELQFSIHKGGFRANHLRNLRVQRMMRPSYKEFILKMLQAVLSAKEVLMQRLFSP